MELEDNQTPQEFIYADEAGFNLGKTCRWRQNIIGKMATVDVPGQRRANSMMCVAISSAGLDIPGLFIIFNQKSGTWITLAYTNHNALPIWQQTTSERWATAALIYLVP